jgi:uncharacterized protein involved in outer membrane biogenesis
MALLRWLIKFVLGIVLLVVVVAAVLIVFKIPIDLSRFKEPVEILASQALDRPVRIEKSVIISTSLNPYLTLEGLKIQNPEGFNGSDFLTMYLARFQVQLLPLLKMKVHVSEIQVQGLTVNLEENQEGAGNWIFKKQSAGGEKKPETSEASTDSARPERSSKLAGDSFVIEKIDFQDIKVEFVRPGQDQPARFHLDSCLGAMLPGLPLELDLKGSLLEFDYTVNIEVGSLEELLTENRSWMDINAAIAGIQMSFDGNVDLATAARSLTLQTTLQGENLSSLNDLLRVDLPPLTNYEVETSLHLMPNQFELQKLVVKTGSSSLEGSAKIVKGKDLTSIDVSLHSPLVQIDDFVFDDWSWSGEEVGEKDVAAEKSPDTQGKEENRKLIDPELLAKIKFSLRIESEKVLSGEDLLGGGLLKAGVEDGRIQIDPLMFNLPGGKIEMAASVKPGALNSDAALKVGIRNFDIGILVRRTKPESDMGGAVNLDIDIQSTANSIAELLENGNGYFDFSGDLENFSSGIIDLWAVNLVAAIVSNADKSKSQLNCAVGRWSVIDGLLRSDAFFIDTSKMRICADGEVDFKDRTVKVRAKPQAKKAQFFSLATPIEVEGTFDDISIGVGSGGVVGTAVRFVASPVTVPLKRTFSNKIPEDGSDVCNMEIGAASREKIEVPLCKSN